MEISRSREHVVNLQNYESVRVGASVRFTQDDIDRFENLDAAIRAADEYLDDLLRDDLTEAAANVPEGKETHLDTWKK